MNGKALGLLYHWIARWYYAWASREIDPLSPDVGRVLSRYTAHSDALRGWL